MDALETGKMAELQKIEFARREQIFRDYVNSDEYRNSIELRAKLYDACLDQRNDSHLSRARIFTLCSREDSPESIAESIIFFINNFGWTYSPKTDPKHLPFILFDYQKDAIRWFVQRIENGEDGLMEKSREMGASWLAVYIALWYWRFRDGANILFGSYKEMLVDDGTVDSLFGKLDYAFESLPKWLKPKRYNANKNRTKLRLKNPENGNLISGDTMNANFGRGARKTFIFFDELGFWDYAKDAWEGAADSTNCRIANSTPNGYNFYAMLRNSGINILTMLWELHPLKDQKWYEFEKLRRTPESFAQEIDISYSQSLEGRVYPDWNENNLERGVFPYDHNLPLFIAWDFGKTDDTGIIWAQPYRGKLRIIDTYRNTGKLIDFYIPFITGIVNSEFKYTSRELTKISSHKDWRKATHFGDPAGRFQNQVSNDTVLTRLRNSGIIVNFYDNWKSFPVRKTAARLLILDGIQINLNDDTKYFDICMQNAAYPKVKYQGVAEVRSLDPIHNWTSHYRSAFEYLALGLSTYNRERRQVRDRFPKGSFNTNKAVGY